MPFSSLENERDIHYDYAGFRSRSLKYIDSTILPASRSVDFPHIINTTPIFNEETNPTDLRLCGGIATVLFRSDPDLLTKLLDCEVPEFFFLREENRASLGDMVIFRENRTVTVSLARRLPLTSHLMIRSALSSTTSTIAWTMRPASYQPSTKMDAGRLQQSMEQACSLCRARSHP